MTWIDCWGDVPGWITPEELADFAPEEVQTVGWLIDPDEHNLPGCTVVAGSKIEDKIGGVMVVPTVLVTSLTVL